MIIGTIMLISMVYKYFKRNKVEDNQEGIEA